MSEKTKYFNDTLNVSERKFKMEMCYDGALVMPKNYAVVNEEEMEYVDGAGRLPNWAVAGAINVGISLIIGGIAGGFKALANSANKAAVGRHVAEASIKQLKRLGMAASAASKVTGIISGLMTFVGALFDPGSYVANKLDGSDKKPNNGWFNW